MPLKCSTCFLFLPFVSISIAALGADPGGLPAPAPEAVLTLAEARQRALAGNPEVLASQAQVRAAEAGLDQARALPNPELSYEVEDFGSTPSADVEKQRTLSLTQVFDPFGKRRARVTAALHDRGVAANDAGGRRLDVLAEVERRFVALLGAQERQAIATEGAATAAQVRSVVAALVQTGEASPIEATRAENEEIIAGVDAATAERDLELAKSALARLWGADRPDFASAAGTLADAVPLPELDVALENLASLPDLARWDEETASLEALQVAARRQPLPDLAFSAGTRWYGGGGHGYVAGVALAIPVLSTAAGARKEAAVRLEQAALARRGEEVRLRSALRETRATIVRALAEVRVLRGEVLPRARQVYEALDEGYRRGKFRLLDLLEARRALAATRLRLVDALVRLNEARADLRRLLPDGDAIANGDQP